MSAYLLYLIEFKVSNFIVFSNFKDIRTCRQVGYIYLLACKVTYMRYASAVHTEYTELTTV